MCVCVFPYFIICKYGHSIHIQRKRENVVQKHQNQEFIEAFHKSW